MEKKKHSRLYSNRLLLSVIFCSEHVLILMTWYTRAACIFSYSLQFMILGSKVGDRSTHETFLYDAWCTGTNLMWTISFYFI